MTPGKPLFGGKAAIAGIGATEFSRGAGRSELQLACESIVAALTDAGLTAADVDGLVSYTIDPVEETELVRSVGIPGDRLFGPRPLRRGWLDGSPVPRRRRGGQWGG